MVCEKQPLLKFRLACFHELTHFKMLLDVYYSCEQTIAKDKHFLHNVSYTVPSRFHLNTLAAPAESWRLFASDRQTDRTEHQAHHSHSVHVPRKGRVP